MLRKPFGLALSLAALAAGCLDGGSQSRPPAQPGPGGYGPPPGGYQPAPWGGYGPGAYPAPTTQLPPGQYPQGQPPPQPVPAPQPTPGPVLAAPPAGSFDASGAMTPQFIRQEPTAVLAELVAALADGPRAKVAGVPLTIIESPKEVNAFAGCDKSGGAFVAITVPLLVFHARAAEARAYDEVFGSSKYNELANGIAGEVKSGQAIAGPGPGFLPLPQALDTRKLARQKFLFDEQVGFVLGHELAHHHRGHTGCASGASQGLGPDDIGRLLSNAVPLLNQPNEIEADVYGTDDALDAGARRAGGTWTEEGAVMTLDFFSRLQSLGVDTLFLGFLMTHPLPQIRLPIVQSRAQQWRATGGHPPPFPLPFALPNPFNLPGT